MTIEQIEQTLPNGLHDAQVRRLHWDFERATLILEVEILVSRPGADRPGADHYRAALLNFESVYFMFSEPPQADAPFLSAGTLWFGYERTAVGRLPTGMEARLPPGALCYSFFIQQWLAELHVAAGDVTFSWLQD